MKEKRYYRFYEKLFASNVQLVEEDVTSSTKSEQQDSKQDSSCAKDVSNSRNNEPDTSISNSRSSPETRSSAEAVLSHVDQHTGAVRMVDVGSKPSTVRTAVATGRVLLGDLAFQLVSENRASKGDVLAAAQIAGIMAAKRTAELIPLCHVVGTSSVDVRFSLDPSGRAVEIRCTAKAFGPTGVEMEALVGVSVAALTVYDMCKSVSHDIVISDARLLSKTGGKSDYHRHEEGAKM